MVRKPAPSRAIRSAFGVLRVVACVGHRPRQRRQGAERAAVVVEYPAGLDATVDSAASFDADSRMGRVRAGLYADLVVLEGNVLDGADLLSATVVRTIVGGRTVFARD